MVTINVILTVKNESDIDEVRALLVEHGGLSRKEPGCQRFEVYHSQADRRVFLLNEHWATQADLDTHRLAHAVKTIYQPKILPKVERTPHPSDLLG